MLRSDKCWSAVRKRRAAVCKPGSDAPRSLSLSLQQCEPFPRMGGPAWRHSPPYTKGWGETNMVAVKVSDSLWKSGTVFYCVWETRRQIWFFLLITNKKLSTGSQHLADLSVQARAQNDISCSGGYRMWLIGLEILYHRINQTIITFLITIILIFIHT